MSKPIEIRGANGFAGELAQTLSDPYLLGMAVSHRQITPVTLRTRSKRGGFF